MDSGTKPYSSRLSWQLKIATTTKPPMFVSCAATYAYHLTQSHAFFDGNKRVGAAVTEAFLEPNGYELTMTNEEIGVLFLSIAASDLSREQVEQQLRNKVRPKN